MIATSSFFFFFFVWFHHYPGLDMGFLGRFTLDCLNLAMMGWDYVGVLGYLSWISHLYSSMFDEMDAYMPWIYMCIIPEYGSGLLLCQGSKCSTFMSKKS